MRESEKARLYDREKSTREKNNAIRPNICFAVFFVIFFVFRDRSMHCLDSHEAVSSRKYQVTNYCSFFANVVAKRVCNYFWEKTQKIK